MDHAAKKGIRIYENTEMNGHHYDKELGKMIVFTKNGRWIQARYVIFAAGYEGMEIKKEKKASCVSTYTITTISQKSLRVI